MSKKVKIILAAVASALVIAGICFYPMAKKYFLRNDYKQYLTEQTEFETGTTFAPIKEKEASVAGMVLAAENESFKLYTNTDTAEVALYDKRSGEIYYTNPIDREGKSSQDLEAQFSLTYYDSMRKTGRMDSYEMSVKRGQVVCESITDGLRYTYTLGNLESETGIVPLVISEERLNSFMANVDESKAKNIMKKYKQSETYPGCMELLEASKTAINIKRMTEIFVEAGYTQEDYAFDMADADLAEPISFTVPLDYRLTKDGLAVSIVTSQIKETGGAKLYSVVFQKQFGAAGREAEGYMLVPNGSGSLIYLNNGKTEYSYTQYVYDTDPTVASYTTVENTTPVRLPVFGVKSGNSALFAMITGGDALARIDAATANNISDYNNVYATFYLRGFELLSMFGTTGSQADLPVLENELYDTVVQVEYIPLYAVEYHFLTGEEADYSGMAAYYRNRLISEGVLKETLKNTELPLYLDILGGVNISKNVAGIMFEDVYEMTTYEQAAAIAKDLADGGVPVIKMNYLGWFNGGFYHDVPDKIQRIKGLGSKKEIAELKAALESTGGSLYGNVAFNTVTYASDRYNLSQEAAKYYNGKIVLLGPVSPNTLKRSANAKYEETMYTMLSPRFLHYYVDKFTEAFDAYDMTGVALRDLGSTLSADKKRADLIHRQDALTLTEMGLETLSNETKLLVHAGNAYSLGYAAELVDVPLSGSNFYVVDEMVPFYAMVVHGYLNYAGEELNLLQSPEREDLLLDLIENGAAPRYVVSWKNSDAIKYSGLNTMYSVQYELYEEEIKSFYDKMSEALGDVMNVPMVKHEILSKDVRKITYENGIVIYVNRGDKEAVADGIRVPANWYAKKEGN